MDTWYIAEGELHCVEAGGATRSVQSPFVQEALQRNERSRQVDAWKTAQPAPLKWVRLKPRSARSP